MSIADIHSIFSGGVSSPKTVTSSDSKIRI